MLYIKTIKTIKTIKINITLKIIFYIKHYIKMIEKYIIKDKKYSNLLLYSSQLFLLNSIIAYVYNLYDYSIISFCVYIN